MVRNFTWTTNETRAALVKWMGIELTEYSKLNVRGQKKRGIPSESKRTSAGERRREDDGGAMCNLINRGNISPPLKFDSLYDEIFNIKKIKSWINHIYNELSYYSNILKLDNLTNI